ncbi:hypothetical protein Ade02nite_14980 [Paractinoplanes deccanensis]|uniref:eCIS core domain-containing protein n=1 Tax=Paractinoplanes deccanensis TaxID=113561 RepID=A0ABQ3XYP0_9ACTN|nr:DUF4157 domain-containing protein [Actinoplanes deccanensis]GID72857.1 hypothetical protein Ade02nite_14980 [Actinoplanes deccanensis]
MTQAGGDVTPRSPAPAPTPEPQQRVGHSSAWEAALLIVEDGVAAGATSRSVFLDRLKAELEAMVDDEMRDTPWQGRDCPWISRYVEGFRVRPLADLRAVAARYGDRMVPGTGLPGLRAALVERARDGLRQWRATGEVPRLPPGFPLPPAGLAGAARVLRKPDGSGRPPEAGVPRLGGGQALDGSDRSWLEHAYGQDLSAIRVHRGAAASDAAARQAALAFSLGDDIVLGAEAAGAPPLSRRALLAHEAAHVLQQRSAATTPDPALESDADTAAGHALLGLHHRPRAGGGLRLQRCGTPAAMSQEEIADYLAGNHLRVVVTGETEKFVAGMKKPIAVAANADASVQQVVRQPADQLIVNSPDYPRLTAVAVEEPFPDGSRSTRYLTVHRRTGTFPVTLMFPGRREITAWVLLAPGHVVELHRSIDVAPFDFAGESEKAAPEQLAGQPANTPLLERLGLTLQRADLRRRAVDAGLLSTTVADAWTAVSLAVVARATALQAGEPGAGTGTAIDDALARFATSFGAIPAGLRAPIGALRARAYHGDLARLRSATELLSRAFDTWVVAQLHGKAGGDELAKGITYAGQVEDAVARIEQRAKGGAVRLPAVFHPEAAYVRRELFVSGPQSLGKIVALPLNLWLFSEGGTNWTLRDITNPEETFEYDTTNADRDAAVDNLLKQLADDEEHWPNGRLHVQPPGRPRQSFDTDSDMDFTDWVALFALALTAAGLILVTAGAATPGVVAAGGYLLTASAVVGAATAVVDTVDAYERGRLTAKRLALNALQIVASAAGAGTSTIFANSARQGVSGLAKLGANARYIFLNRSAAAADVVTLLVMTGDTALQLAKLAIKGDARSPDTAARAALALGQLLVQGTITTISAKDAFRGGDLSGHPPVALHEGADGLIVVRPPGGTAGADAPAAPRIAEDLLDKAGTHFSPDHKTLRTAYGEYLARQRAKPDGGDPLGPLDWLKFQSHGKAADYLDATLPAGWREARRGQYPGSRPELIERPSNSPPEGSINPVTKTRWRYKRVTIDDLRPSVDEDGDPFWTFPDLEDGEVLLLPSGTRVWKHPVTKAVIEEHPIGPSVSGQRNRTAGEAVLMSRADVGPEHAAAGTERSHGAASPGLGFDSPYSPAHAPPRVNQAIERAGIETYLRRLRDNAPAGVTYLSTTSTVYTAPSRTLVERTYRIDAIKDGKIHRMFEFKVVVEGGVADVNARFVTDEMSVFPGAEQFGAPKLRVQPAGAPPEGNNVQPPPRLKDLMAPQPGRAPVAPPPEVPGFEASQEVRRRLDDLLEARIQRKTLDPAWMDAQSGAVDVLHRAEAEILGGTDAVKQQKLRDLLKSMTLRTGRHPHTVTTKRLQDFTAAVMALL